MLKLRLVLKLGAVQELMYQAAVKLCKVTGVFVDNVCDDVKVSEATKVRLVRVQELRRAPPAQKPPAPV